MREISAEGGGWVCGCACDWEGIRTQDRENLQSLRIDVSQSFSFFLKIQLSSTKDTGPYEAKAILTQILCQSFITHMIGFAESLFHTRHIAIIRAFSEFGCQLAIFMVMSSHTRIGQQMHELPSRRGIYISHHCMKLDHTRAGVRV